ncbi:MAG: shikimate kinase [Bacillota bacterium]|nr:shikimate kinase [Bacillota bacterium]
MTDMIRQASANTGKDNIVLVGFMGSGKTVIGRNVARLLDFDFADTDEMIRDTTGMSLPQLLRKHGHIRVCSEEALVLKKLAAASRQVIAAGGSLLPQQSNIGLLVKSSYFVLLHAEPQVIHQRLGRKNDRLLPYGKPTLPQLEQLIAEREREYRRLADLILDTGSMGVEEAAVAIADSYKASCR